MTFELRNIQTDVWERLTARAERDGWDVRDLVTQLMRDYGSGAITPTVAPSPAEVVGRRIIRGQQWEIQDRLRRVKFGHAELEPTDPRVARITFRYEGDPSDRFSVLVPLAEAERDPGWVQNEIRAWLQQDLRVVGSRLVLAARNS